MGAARHHQPAAGAGRNITNKAQPLSVFHGGITAIRPALLIGKFATNHREWIVESKMMQS